MTNDHLRAIEEATRPPLTETGGPVRRRTRDIVIPHAALALDRSNKVLAEREAAKRRAVDLGPLYESLAAAIEKAIADGKKEAKVRLRKEYRPCLDTVLAFLKGGAYEASYDRTQLTVRWHLAKHDDHSDYPMQIHIPVSDTDFP